MTPESLRVKMWREANKERYNASQRELMAKRRAKKRAEREAAKEAEKLPEAP